jgi:hypothetical protein
VTARPPGRYHRSRADRHARRHMSSISRQIPVIDLFAGPGGLGEGSSAMINERGRHPFHIALSIEKDAVAHLHEGSSYHGW